MSLKWLQEIEKHSLTMIYLHIFTDILLNDYFEYGIIGLTAFELVIPIVVSIIIRSFLPHGKLLLGNFSPKTGKLTTVPAIT